MATINKQMKTLSVPSGSDTIKYEIVDDAGRSDISDLNSTLNNVITEQIAPLEAKTEETENRIDTIIGYQDYAFSAPGSYIAINNTATTVDPTSTTSNTNGTFTVINVSEGEEYEITANRVQWNMLVWAVIDANNLILLKATYNEDANKVKVVIPGGAAKLIVNAHKSYTSLVFKGYNKLYQNVQNASARIDGLTKVPIVYPDNLKGVYIDATNGYFKNNNTSNWVSDLIRVAGKVYLTGVLKSAYNAWGWIACYNIGRQFIGYSSIATGEYMTLTEVPLVSGTEYVRVQIGSGYANTVSVYVYNINEPLYNPIIDIPLTWDSTDGYIGGLHDDGNEETNNNDWKKTEYIPVPPTKVYYSAMQKGRYINNYTIHYLFAYDFNKNYIGSFLLSTGTGSPRFNMQEIDLPSNTAYVRFYNGSAAIDANTAVKFYETCVLQYDIRELPKNEKNGLIRGRTYIDEYIDTFPTFYKFGVIGDSLSVGWMQNPEDTSEILTRAILYSWPQVLARKYGNIALNFGKSGVTTKGWIQEYSSLMQDPDNLCQTYVIGLGANDIASAVGTGGYGTVADINWSNYTQNADSFCGHYGKLIQMVREAAPLAPIFLLTLGPPRAYTSNVINVNPAIRNVYNAAKTHISKIYLGDLENDYNYECIQLEHYGQGGHYTALGYRAIASMINMILSNVMQENLSDFGNIGFIPYGSNNIIE